MTVARVEHTGEWIEESEALSRYRDSLGVVWNVLNDPMGLGWLAQVDPASAKDAKDYARTELTGASRDELQGQIDRAADDLWYSSRLQQKKSSGGGGGLALLALFAFSGKKKRGRRR